MKNAEKKILNFLSQQNKIHATESKIVLCLDATSSMSRLMKNLKEKLTEMINRVKAIAGDSCKIAFNIIIYRDYDCKNGKLVDSSGWRTDAESLIDYVNNIEVHGGEDFEEAIEIGLREINALPTDQLPSRVLLMGDAPPHFERKGEKIKKQGGYVLETDYHIECQNLSEKSIPVYSFYMHDGARESFHTISRLTNGDAKALDVCKENQLLDAVCLETLDDIGGEGMKQKYIDRFIGHV